MWDKIKRYESQIWGFGEGGAWVNKWRGGHGEAIKKSEKSC